MSALIRSSNLVRIAANVHFPPITQKYCIAVIGNMGSKRSLTPEKMNAALVKINEIMPIRLMVHALG